MFKTELLIAWRYIKSNRREKFISAIATFSIIGIALGVATLIIVTSVMNGFRKEFTERVIGFNGHIAMHPIGNAVDYRDVVKQVSAIDDVRQVVPVIERHAILSSGKNVSGSLCHGISKQDLGQMKLIAGNIQKGNLDDFSTEDSIVVGESLANNSELFIGDDVVIMVPELDETGVGFVPRKKTFKLAATFKSGMHEYDKSVFFIPLEMSQKLFKMHGRVDTISVFANDPLRILDVKTQIEEKFSDNFRIKDWQNSNSAFMKAVEIERNVMFLILTLIILVASFNIISCMIMLVKDKEKDIAILRTIGLARASVSRIFFMTGAFVGVSGTIIGTILGLLFSLNIQKIQAFLESFTDMQLFAPEVYFLTHLPSLLRPVDVLITVIVSLLLSCLSTLYPSKKASRLNPVEILRYA
ncbi:ABC transporter permease [Alphaproteobacteria bacterium]|nr:ABC transporter permease [Alphaproteobacteria bacterium]